MVKCTGGVSKTIHASYHKVSAANFRRDDRLGATGIMETYNGTTTEQVSGLPPREG